MPQRRGALRDKEQKLVHVPVLISILPYSNFLTVVKSTFCVLCAFAAIFKNG